MNSSTGSGLDSHAGLQYKLDEEKRHVLIGWGVSLLFGLLIIFVLGILVIVGSERDLLKRQLRERDHIHAQELDAVNAGAVQAVRDLQGEHLGCYRSLSRCEARCGATGGVLWKTGF